MPRTKKAIAAETICHSLPVVLEAGIDQFKNEWEIRRVSCKQSQQNVSALVGPASPIIDEDWTAQDELWLMATWNNSSTKLALARIGSQNQELHKLWRISCTLMQCSPVSIISPQYGLIYDGFELTAAFSSRLDSDQNDQNESPLWSESFCKALHALVVHSFWRGDVRLLVNAIQYAVICRTDDRQPWEMAMRQSSCLDIESLRSLAASQRRKHIHSLQEELNASQTASGRDLSLEYEFFNYLGSIIEKPSYGYAVKQNDEHPPAYHVQTADLNAILRALNTFNLHGFPLFTHSEIFLIASKSAPLSYVFPARNEVCELHMRSFLHETRMAYRKVRSARKSTSQTPRAHRDFSYGKPASSSTDAPVKWLRRVEGHDSTSLEEAKDRSRQRLLAPSTHHWRGRKTHQLVERPRGQQRRQTQSASPHSRRKHTTGYWPNGARGAEHSEQIYYPGSSQLEGTASRSAVVYKPSSLQKRRREY
ncbi:hypothetical protein E4U17_002924 [Claviceps sp. LM77 group G4]|nr:hypothetical protein E4U17_002924 [Claviceps sp. LM77 group G4]KAG6071170.1 hypothetical protein E4U33_003851 [Claviceps sp. LM78 group G4]KAG6075951.1 hypothetical protein E4U16_003051 [Claviceps sp. LM84 group G4]